MKIAIVAPVIERVPPQAYGGTERIVYGLTEELVKLGHQVTLFASGDSQTSARLVSVVPKPLREMNIKDLYGPNQYTLLNIGMAYSHQEDFDIIHDHNNYLSLPAANISKTPVVMTIHNAITPDNKKLFEVFNNPYLVAISHSQTQTMANLNFIGTVHNGLEMEHYPFSETDDGYLLYVGRISPEKGVHLAIEAAHILQIPLILAAKLDEKDIPYFHEYIEPKLDGNLVKWIGEVDESKRNQLMRKAKCFLHPATWREPFGLTLIEAQATGCPVVAFNKGAMSEIILDGSTGFVVNDLQEMVEAIKKIDTVSRQNCRAHVLKNFSAKKMALGYEAVYYQILNEKLIQNRPTIFDLPNPKVPQYVSAHDIKKPKRN